MKFSLSTNPTQASVQFSQDQVNQGVVTFYHDGSKIPPFYQVTVSNGVLSAPPVLPLISFTTVNHVPQSFYAAVVGED